MFRVICMYILFFLFSDFNSESEVQLINSSVINCGSSANDKESELTEQPVNTSVIDCSSSANDQVSELIEKPINSSVSLLIAVHL